MDAKELYKNVIYDGCSIEIGKLSICCINHWVKGHPSLQFQVHCDHPRVLRPDGTIFSELYDELDIAVDKFLMLKGELYGQSCNQS